MTFIGHIVRYTWYNPLLDTALQQSILLTKYSVPLSIKPEVPPLTTEEFEICLRKMQSACVRRAIVNELTEDAIYRVLKENALTEAAIQSTLQMHRRLQRRESKHPEWILEDLQKSCDEDNEDWEDR